MLELIITNIIILFVCATQDHYIILRKIYSCKMAVSQLL